MDEQQLLENICEIRKALEELKKGMAFLMESVSVAENLEDENDGKFSKELSIPNSNKKDDDDDEIEPLQFRTYLG
jgi:hypothetical protein